LPTADGGKIRPVGSRGRHEDIEEGVMCANCGCGIPEDKHGDDRNIAWSEIVASAEANDISPAEAVSNMQEMARQQG
jgi:ribosomal protein S26